MSLVRSIAGATIASLAMILACAAEDAPPGEVQAQAATTPLASQPLDGLSATRERPLFSPTRRPPPPPPVIVTGPPPPPPPPPPPDVALFGIVMDGENARAIIRASPGGKVTRVGIGDDVGGWKVAQIDGRKLVLMLDERLVTFVMFTSKNANSARSGPALQAMDNKPQDAATQKPEPPNPQPPSATGPHRVRRPN
jgi:outer membrane biosynthesis protein TonB